MITTIKIVLKKIDPTQIIVSKVIKTDHLDPESAGRVWLPRQSRRVKSVSVVPSPQTGSERGKELPRNSDHRPVENVMNTKRTKNRGSLISLCKKRKGMRHLQCLCHTTTFPFISSLAISHCLVDCSSVSVI